MLFIRERSWDFMPPDVVRPVASIQIRALIVLAARLGTQWSGLDLKSDGGLSAQGNSFYLTSVSLRSPGTVMRFGSDGHTSRELGCIPSITADKLLCGILPGCGDLCPEVKIVGDDRTQSLIGNLLDVLRLPGEVYKCLADLHFRKRLGFRENIYKRMVANDAMILFCPFLPKKLCTSVHCYFYAWSGKNPIATFHLWESRRALLVQLRKRIETLKELPKVLKLRYVEECLGPLETDYQSDFYIHSNDSLISLGPDEARVALEKDGRKFMQNRMKFLDCLREIFEQTQIFFKSLQPDDAGNFAERSMTVTSNTLISSAPMLRCATSRRRKPGHVGSMKATNIPSIRSILSIDLGRASLKLMRPPPATWSSMATRSMGFAPAWAKRDTRWTI